MLDPVARTHHIEQHFHGRHREQFRNSLLGLKKSKPFTPTKAMRPTALPPPCVASSTSCKPNCHIAHIQGAAT
jgi:hypothetical protein